MKLKLVLYEQIISKYKALNTRNCLKSLKASFPDVSALTLSSIIALENVKKTKRSHSLHTTQSNKETYYKMYKDAVAENRPPGFLLRIADAVDFSPALMAKLIMDQFFADEANKGGVKIDEKTIKQMLRDTTTIPDSILAAEVFMCVINDNNYGPVADAYQKTIGTDYELFLKHELDQLRLPYIDENDLRERGYDKTPDIKLELPIAINGRIVNWIESKASFGDKVSHNGYLKDQYWSYWNRFGPGLVIYWFGFIEELDVHADDGIMICDHLPKNIVSMDPDKLVPR